MSNTPNPNRNTKRSLVKEIIMAPIWRDAEGLVHVPSGTISREGYEKVCAEHPMMMFPRFSELPIRTS